MSDKILVDNAKEDDIPAIAALFTDSFRESVIHHCGRLPHPQAMEDVFTLVYKAEPAAAFVARSGEKIAGYCFAPVNLPGLWVRAVTGGHIIKWAWRWITGRYGFGIHPVKIIVLNKIAFLRSAVVPSKAANARILSIAVAEDRRGQGVASRLMQAALEYFQAKQARLIRLEVRPDNTPAVRVYEKLGFVKAGTTCDSQGDWLIMFKEME